MEHSESSRSVVRGCFSIGNCRPSIADPLAKGFEGGRLGMRIRQVNRVRQESLERYLAPDQLPGGVENVERVDQPELHFPAAGERRAEVEVHSALERLQRIVAHEYGRLEQTINLQDLRVSEDWWLHFLPGVRRLDRRRGPLASEVRVVEGSQLGVARIEPVSRLDQVHETALTLGPLDQTEDD